MVLQRWRDERDGKKKAKDPSEEATGPDDTIDGDKVASGS